MNNVGGALNTVGSEVNYVKNQITYNSDKIDALNTGLGSLVDADLAKRIGAASGTADPSAAGHSGAVAGEPGAADAAEPVQVTGSGTAPPGWQNAHPEAALRASFRWQRVVPHRDDAKQGSLMSNLVLELRQGEMMIVNGAPIRFRTKSRIELTAKARFLFGKQIMPPDQAGQPGPANLFCAAVGLHRLRGGAGQRLASARELIARVQGRPRHPPLPARSSIERWMRRKSTTATRR